MRASVVHQRAAPIWKQLLAGLIDDVPSMAYQWHRSKRDSGASHRPVPLEDVLRRAYSFTAKTVFGRTVGQRLVGIRVVGQETGRPPSLKQVTLSWAIAGLPQLVLRYLPRSAKEQQRWSQIAELKPELKQLELQHQGDREAYYEAVQALYKEREVNPSRACLPELLRVAVGQLYFGLLLRSARRDPLNQDFAERWANILVIEDISYAVGGRGEGGGARQALSDPGESAGFSS